MYIIVPYLYQLILLPFWLSFDEVRHYHTSLSNEDLKWTHV